MTNGTPDERLSSFLDARDQHLHDESLKLIPARRGDSGLFLVGDGFRFLDLRDLFRGYPGPGYVGRGLDLVPSGDVLIHRDPRERRIWSVLGLSMEQNNSGLEELGTGELAVGGAASYDYSETTGRGHIRVERQPKLPSELFRYRVVKRFFDLLLVVLAMPVLVPLMLVLAILVRATSAGPVFFSHRRICRNGAFFSMWKFRTMCVNSSEVLERYLAAHPEARAEWNLTHKLQDDPRVTRVGRTMRRLSLDELPQIWNVITGQMSLVGPRPIVAAEVEKYGDLFRWYTCVKPGVTGLWQVSGRSTLSYDARVKLDREYATNWSLMRDLRILGVTVRSVVNQEGAY